MVSGEAKPEPLPRSEVLLLESPLYTVYSLTDVSKEVRAEELKEEEAARFMQSLRAAQTQAVTAMLDSTPPPPPAEPIPVERIARLAPLLPDAVVANAALYSILSKGIHDLTENECKAHFPVVRAGIEAILEEKLAEKARHEKAEKAKKAVADLKRQLGPASETQMT